VTGIARISSKLLKTVGLLAVRLIGKTTIKKQKKKKYSWLNYGLKSTKKWVFLTKIRITKKIHSPLNKKCENGSKIRCSLK